jgi:hypothetical protein
MRAIILVLLIVGAVFVGTLLFYPQEPATSEKPGYRPTLPEWAAFLKFQPPSAEPLPGTTLPTSLAGAESWSGRFTAGDRKVATVRVRLVDGKAVTVTASEPGQDEQFLCIVAKGAQRPPGCDDKNMADGLEGSVVVRKGTATTNISAPSGPVTLAVND